MKRIILAILFIIFLPFIALATSGACSSHGGVYCMLGADYDGSVICNDFSSDSTVYYWDMVECGGTITQILSNCPATGNLETQINDLVSQFYNLQSEELQKELNLHSEGISQYAMNGRIILLRRDLGIKLSSIYGDIKAKCQTAYNQYQEQQLETIRQQQLLKEQQFESEHQAIQQKIQVLEQLKQVSSCPAGTTLGTDNKCYCSTGYVWNGNACITMTQYCQNKYGVNSYSSNGQCYCSDGYTYYNDTCISYTNRCKVIYGENIVGTKATNGGVSCNCETGYQWNPSQTACLKIIEKEDIKPITKVVKETELPQQFQKPQSRQIEENNKVIEEIKTEEKSSEQNQQINKEKNRQEKRSFLKSISIFFNSLFAGIKNFFSRIFK